MRQTKNNNKCGGLWTSARYYGFIRSGLRRMWVKYPLRREALLKARREYKGPNKAQKWEYKCNQCKKWFMQKEVEVDHINECGSLSTDEEIAIFAVRLFVDNIKHLQVLCKPCHRSKTNEAHNK